MQLKIQWRMFSKRPIAECNIVSSLLFCFFTFVGSVDERADRDWEYQAGSNEKVIVAGNIHQKIEFWKTTLNPSSYVTAVLENGCHFYTIVHLSLPKITCQAPGPGLSPGLGSDSRKCKKWF